MQFLRWTRLSLTDFGLYIINRARSRVQNRVFLAEHRDFPVPPYTLAHDAYGHTNWAYYYKQGRELAGLICEHIDELLPPGEIKVLEWGCGPARVIRHVQALLGRHTVRLYGTDYNEKTINWCNKNIKGISFQKNLLAPPLPFDSGYFDCVFNISVFTHLSRRMHHEWMRELSRVTRPGGVIILTTHGDAFRNKLLDSEQKTYDSGDLVVRGGIKEGTKNFTAFHPPRFMREELLKDIQVVRHIPGPTPKLHQDIWVARNTA